MNITPAQNKRLHLLLTQTSLQEQKAALVFSATHGRSESSKDLTIDEARKLITYLNHQPNIRMEKSEKMRCKIISMAHECGWHTLMNDKWVIDMNRLNAWMLKSSYLHKNINAYKYNELPKLVTQFEQVYKSFLNKV